MLSVLAVAAPDLVVRSAAGCPAAADVIAQIGPLLPPGVTVAAGGTEDSGVNGGDLAEIVVRDGSRWLRLRGGDGRLRQERTLPDSLSCADAARAAAVLLAAWEFQGRADLPAGGGGAPMPPATAGTPAAAEPIVTIERDLRSSSANVSVVAPPVPATRATTTVGAPAPATATTRLISPTPNPAAARRVGVGAGVALARTADQSPMSAMAELTFGRPEGLGLRAQAALSSQSSFAVGAGRAAWRRASASVGGSLTGRAGGWGAQAHVDLAAGRLSIAGQGFDINQSGTQWVLGGMAGGRVMRRLGSTDLWLDVTAAAWPGRHEVTLRDAAAGDVLPVFEVGVGLGVDFFFGR